MIQVIEGGMNPSLRPLNEGRGLRVAAGDRELARLAKALAHPARAKILRHLAEARECICGDVVLAVGLAQATVSQHLKVLKSAGFIRGTISGPRSCYCVEPRTLARLRALLDAYGAAKKGC